jgi:hypothetical protein
VGEGGEGGINFIDPKEGGFKSNAVATLSAFFNFSACWNKFRMLQK